MSYDYILGIAPYCIASLAFVFIAMYCFIRYKVHKLKKRLGKRGRRNY